jgi:hypothetical protein
MQHLVQSYIVSGADMCNGHLQGFDSQGRAVIRNEHKSMQFGKTCIIRCVGLQILRLLIYACEICMLEK